MTSNTSLNCGGEESSMLDNMKFYGSATVGTKGQVVIPAEAREELSIKEGDKVIAVRMPHGHGLMLLKTEMLEEMLGHMQSHLGSFADSIKDIKETK